MISQPAIDKKLTTPADQAEKPDPNEAQRRAADPAASVWVGASAGTGKTKVLTDRVLRLLLPRPDGLPGTAPQRILCLTFTKAGASEMALRINDTLGKWAVANDEKLSKGLSDLTGTAPDQAMMQAARRLFAAVVDTPGGLKIMTIHSFCQSVLGRFPLEAGVPPHFTVIEETAARELLTQARDQVLARARRAPDSAEGQAVIALAALLNEEQFGKMLNELGNERAQLAALEHGDADTLHFALCDLLGVDPAAREEKLIADFCADDAFDGPALWAACAALAEGTAKSDQPKGEALQGWLESDVAARVTGFESYRALYCTQKGDLRADQMTKRLAQTYPEAADALKSEADRLMALCQQLGAVRMAAQTRDLLLIGRAILTDYQALKAARAVLDYSDLIEKTQNLLAQDGIAPWVLYKLDGGLDHVLVDEAQDTNPEQWDIIKALTGDFFTGLGAHEAGDSATRTIFTVGDEKQSIYSFQRAAPREFQRSHDYLKEAVDGAGHLWVDEALNISFRSGPCVLRLVDKIFEPPDVRAGLGRDVQPHKSYRTGQAGLCELWPLCEPDEAEELAPWSPPVKVSESRSGALKLAEKIGETIENWLACGEMLESQGRAVAPGDIMILLRTRTAFFNQLVRALKTRNIPVSGIDRMVLGEQLAVMDLLAAASFALLPDDDLTLACLLKSPLVGWNEERLYQACSGRGASSLWQRLQQSSTPDEALLRWLRSLQEFAATDHPFEFFSRVLQLPCPGDKKGGLRAMIGRLGPDAVDPLDEFLGDALNYEREHIPTLQGFLAWQKRADRTIKREMEEAGACVRIMTVHGAKGLQAPVVFLPDTTRSASAKKTPRLLWPDKTELALPLWSARAGDEPDLYRAARAGAERQLDEEYRRLLYVALTRAEDRLYIGGYRGRNKPIELCWYNDIAAAFAGFADAEQEPDGARRIHNPQSAAPDRAKTSSEADDENETVTAEAAALVPPSWLFALPAAEPHPPRPLTPSRPSAPEPAARSPLAAEDDYRFRRGNITHRLLQLLPDLAPEQRRAAATHYAARPGHGVPESVSSEIVEEVMAILNDPAYAPLFGPGSLAEVPVTGLIEDAVHGARLVSGAIDRLLVTDRDLWIIDYKTNRPPPLSPEDVPPLYRDQMSAYRATLAAIYPGRAIRTFLLWTDGPVLMEITP